MWVFVVGLFLVRLDLTSLLLTAIYGLTLAITAIVFAPVFGNWVDSHPRLHGRSDFIITASRLLNILVRRQFIIFYEVNISSVSTRALIISGNV